LLLGYCVASFPPSVKQLNACASSTTQNYITAKLARADRKYFFLFELSKKLIREKISVQKAQTRSCEQFSGAFPQSLFESGNILERDDLAEELRNHGGLLHVSDDRRKKASQNQNGS